MSWGREPKRGIPSPIEHGHAGDDQTLNQSGAQELLNGDSTVDVEMLGASGGQACDDIGRSSCHVFHHRLPRPLRNRRDGYSKLLLAFSPYGHGFMVQDGFESVATDDDRIDAGYEFGVAVGFASARAAGSRDRHLGGR